jgi:hypothetical protein
MQSWYWLITEEEILTQLLHKERESCKKKHKANTNNTQAQQKERHTKEEKPQSSSTRKYCLCSY